MTKAVDSIFAVNQSRRLMKDIVFFFFVLKIQPSDHQRVMVPNFGKVGVDNFPSDNSAAVPLIASDKGPTH